MKPFKSSSTQLPRRAFHVWLTAATLPSWTAPASAAASAGSAGRLLGWTRLVLRLVVKYQHNPLRAARALAYAQQALHMAWGNAQGLGPAGAEVAAHRAVSRVLEHLFAHEMPGQFEARFVTLAMQAGDRAPRADQAPDRTQALAHSIGTQVAAALVARSLQDGAGRVWSPRQRPALFNGAWQPTFPLFAANPTEGMAPFWQPWVEPATQRYDPPPAPRPGSIRHHAETQEVLAVARALTPAQHAAAQAWHLDAGSVTPGGVWMQHTLQMLEQPGDGDQRADIQAAGAGWALAVTAAVAIAMHDAFIACWRVKMRDWSERPITAVRRELDPGFTPSLVTPGFPSYVSGHAAVSAAASEVLGAFFPRQQLVLRAQALEAAQSRLWGGLHFRSDNEEGLKLGQSVGREVLAHRAMSASV